VATGHDAIDEAVERLLTNLPPAFAFTAQGPVVGHYGVALLRRIQSLYVLLDPAVV
jgi:hypothetical protein